MPLRSPFGLLLLLVAGALAASCGGGEESPIPTQTPLTTPSFSLSPTPSARTPAPPLPDEVAPSSFVDLAQADPLSKLLAGGDRDLQAGASSLATGDFNADGAADLLIGAPFADGPDDSREDAGEAYVVFGGSNFPATVDLVPGSVDLIIYGALAGDNLGFSVVGGDLNGDGIDDIVVAAPASDGLEQVRTDVGEAYIIFGAPDLGGEADIARVDQDATLRGAEGFARVGTSFGIGDVNGDGLNDLVAGAPFAGREPGSPPGGPRTTIGEVYVVFGSPDLSGMTDVTADQQDLTLTGAEERDAFGQAVLVADVNDDGIDDIIVTARGADGPENARKDAGEAFVFLGSGQLSGKRGVDEADYVIFGAEQEDRLGERLGGGDFNSDGIADIIITAREADGPENAREESGEAYIVYGSPSLSGVLDLSTDAAGVTIYGIGSADLMGAAVGAADVDGDGRDDAILGAALTFSLDNARIFSGEAYVLFGGERLQGSIDLRMDVEGVLFVYGAEPNDNLGAAVALADLNADGAVDLALLAPGAHTPEAPAGKVYVLTPALP